MRNRLTERDLSRIVRRVLKEDEDTTSMVGGCFSKTTLSIPPSCNTKREITPHSLLGTGEAISKECLNAIGGMITYNNLKEVTKILNCLLSDTIPKPKVKPSRVPSKSKTPNLSDEEMNKLYNQKQKHPEIFDPKYEKL